MYVLCRYIFILIMQSFEVGDTRQFDIISNALSTINLNFLIFADTSF
jgi:hypothetical protein